MRVKKKMLKNNIRENGTCIIKNDHVNRCFILNKKNVNDVLFENKRRSENQQLLNAVMYGVLKDYVNSILKEHWLSGLSLAPAEHLTGLYRINGVLNNNQYKAVMRCINNEMLLSCSLYDELKEME